ncbi:MAG TPA: B12-binding domain-containing protein [Candidatus Methanomethylophilaceae archaeon]|nr:B12-binding domain-containing protein [Candidatus Methanomethylophilaceae archaeon]
MNHVDLNQKAKDAVLSHDVKKSVSVAKDAISSGADLVDLVMNGYSMGIREVGDLFELKQTTLAHIMASAETMNAAMEILTPEIEKAGLKLEGSLGKFVICTVQGDIHSIGKDIVAVMMSIAGFKVIDLGRDVPIEDIVRTVKEEYPCAVGTSALMTTTIINQGVLEESLREEGIRDKVITNVGGGPVTQQWSDKIGADVYSENASDCVKKMIDAMN